MADIKPNLEIRKKHLKIRKTELELNLQRMEVRLMEFDDEKAKIAENVSATQKALEEITKELEG